jgi:hypothetical protein
MNQSVWLMLNQPLFLTYPKTNRHNTSAVTLVIRSRSFHAAEYCQLFATLYINLWPVMASNWSNTLSSNKEIFHCIYEQQNAQTEWKMSGTLSRVTVTTIRYHKRSHEVLQSGVLSTAPWGCYILMSLNTTKTAEESIEIIYTHFKNHYLRFLSDFIWNYRSTKLLQIQTYCRRANHIIDISLHIVINIFSLYFVENSPHWKLIHTRYSDLQ